MMDFSSVVLWWEEWQLRLLVLGSLSLQYFLAFAAIHRRRSIPSSLRLLIWLAFLGSDAVAISALATALLTRQKKVTTGGDDGVSRVVLGILRSPTDGGKDGGLQIFWAPILLLHLAGPDSITAYNIEDNELWKRHIMTVIYKVTGAIYVFHQSWSGASKLLTAAVLLFIAGILKCVEKPMALKCASIFTLVTSSPYKYDNVAVDVETNLSLEDYVAEAKDYFETVEVGDTVVELIEAANQQLRVIPHWLFVDLASTLCHRLKVLHMFLVFDNNGADYLLQQGLCGAFVRLYTKHSMLLSFLWIKNRTMGLISACAYLNRVLAVCLTISAAALFHQSHKQGYDDSDVKVTYALLWGAAGLEVHALFSKKYDFTWTNRVAQYNLIESFARGRNPSKLLRLAGFCGCKDLVEQRWYVDHCSSSFPITELVIQQVKDGWNDYIQGVSTYWAFNDRRGQLTLQQEGCNDELRSTLEVPFDESILVWHMATDICFYHQIQVQVQGGSGEAAPAAAGHCDAATRCREISNYLVYLLVTNPEMLMAGTRVTIFSEACEELRYIFEDDVLLPGEEGELAQEIHTRAQATEGDDATETTKAFVLRASKLASQLLAMDADRRWRVMQGVWAEMLCFSASRCRGYLHAKSLGTGGEYLSYVWLLLWYMGLESVAERQQRSDFRNQGAP